MAEELPVHVAVPAPAYPSTVGRGSTARHDVTQVSRGAWFHPDHCQNSAVLWISPTHEVRTQIQFGEYSRMASYDPGAGLEDHVRRHGQMQNAECPEERRLV